MTRFVLPLVMALAFISARVSADSHLKNYTLQNSEGKPIQLTDLKGDYIFISFIYSHCPVPKMCPLTISLNRRVFKLWKERLGSVPLKFLIVTLDPANDSPAIMKAYGKKMGLTDPAFILATGDEQTISDFSSEFNAIGFPSGNMIAHNSKSILVGPSLLPLKDYKDNEWSPDEVIRDLKTFNEKAKKKS